MLNPEDGQITYYHSPMFGLVEKYDTLQELLSAHDSEALELYLAQSKVPAVKSENIQKTDKVELAIVDIKNSPYAGSMAMNQLQRLFDAKVLRAWDESLPNMLKKRLE